MAMMIIAYVTLLEHPLHQYDHYFAGHLHHKKILLIQLFLASLWVLIEQFDDNQNK